MKKSFISRHKIISSVLAVGIVALIAGSAFGIISKKNADAHQRQNNTLNVTAIQDENSKQDKKKDSAYRELQKDEKNTQAKESMSKTYQKNRIKNKKNLASQEAALQDTTRQALDESATYIGSNQDKDGVYDTPENSALAHRFTVPTEADNLNQLLNHSSTSGSFYYEKADASADPQVKAPKIGDKYTITNTTFAKNDLSKLNRPIVNVSVDYGASSFKYNSSFTVTGDNSGRIVSIVTQA